MSKVKDLSGRVFGRLVVIERFGRTKSRSATWKCICKCGKEAIVSSQLLSNGRTTSCGCYNKERTLETTWKHGMSRTKFYGVWNTMVMRCHNPKAISYDRYGGAGVEVCERWRTFQNFYDDMHSSYKPGLTIDRIDGTKGYSPDNCAWKTPIEQSNNRKSNSLLEYRGEKLTMSQMARKYGISIDTFKRRLYYGWSVERAINEPIHWRGQNEGGKSGESN